MIIYEEKIDLKKYKFFINLIKNRKYININYY